MIDDFLTARSLATTSKNSFDALIMAAVRKASTENLAKLRKAFPALVDEAIARANTKDGALPSD